MTIKVMVNLVHKGWCFRHKATLLEDIRYITRNEGEVELKFKVEVEVLHRAGWWKKKEKTKEIHWVYEKNIDVFLIEEIRCCA